MGVANGKSKRETLIVISVKKEESAISSRSSSYRVMNRPSGPGT